MDTLRGVIERITYHNEENGYTVAKMSPEARTRTSFGQGGEIAIVGNMAGINVGEFVELSGRWTIHAEYGKQFSVEQMRSVLPATVAGIEKYLGSGLIKGVGPVTAKRIVRHFGVETLEIIEGAPERLQEVPGVGRKRVQLIVRAWAEQQAIKEVMLFLQSHGVSTSLATKIYKFYGDAAVGIVQSDPYRLARDIFGIGFLTADKIARSLGIPADSPQRVAAGVAYTLNQASDEGHVYLPSEELLSQAAELLEVLPNQVATGIVQLWDTDQVKVALAPGGEEQGPFALSTSSGTPQLVAEAGQLYAPVTVERAHALLNEPRVVYLSPFYYSEKGVAGQLRRLVEQGSDRLAGFRAPGFDWEARFTAVEDAQGLRLAPQQRAAVRAALTRRIAILTGGPGTGKTTTVHTVLQLCQQAGHRVLLAAPTGRAAKRLSETTGYEAKTIHRLLEFKPAEGMSFQRNEGSPLECDLLIIDEASMLDLVLTNHLLKAVSAGTHLLLVGDVDQLPSVGAGNVLKDIIAAVEQTAAIVTVARPPDALLPAQMPKAATISERAQWGGIQGANLVGDQMQVVRLQTIFRQAADSFIIENAHRINQGQMPTIDNDHASDFFLFRITEPERAAQLCVELVQSRIPRRFAIPTTDIQVLSPMHRGAVGVANLNTAIQSAINPPRADKPERAFGNRIYRVGDRVMQIRNNYDKEVYNGDMGVITALDLELQRVIVTIDGRPIPYEFLELDELVHAFAISVHKSQGSEFPAVVIPIVTSHYMMLQRNLLYTAVSRARRLVVLVGQTRAIAMAVRNDKVTERFTGLRERFLQTG